MIILNETIKLLNQGNKNEVFRIDIFDEKEENVKIIYIKDKDTAFNKFEEIRKKNNLVVNNVRYSKIFNHNKNNYNIIVKESSAVNKNIIVRGV